MFMKATTDTPEVKVTVTSGRWNHPVLAVLVGLGVTADLVLNILNSVGWMA